MKIIQHTEQTSANLEDIWRLYQDVKHWNLWDHGIEYSEIYGPFENGTKGVLKPKGGPLVHTELKDVIAQKSFVDVSKLPLTRIIVSHRLEKTDQKTTVTHSIEMKGLGAFFFAWFLGRKMKKNLLVEMKALVTLAEKGAHE